MIQVMTVGGAFEVRGAFADKDKIKTIAGRRWDAERRAWVIPRSLLTAGRLIELFPRTEINADNDFWSMANDATELADMGVQVVEDLPQPEIRSRDSWRHQLEAYHFAKDKHAAMLAMAMGTGKTKVVVDLVFNRNHKRVLIVCPKSVIDVWQNEFEKHAGGRDYMIYNSTKGSVERRTGEIAAFLERCDVYGCAAVVVLNYEAAWRAPLGTTYRENGRSRVKVSDGLLKKAKFDLAVLDECLAKGTAINTAYGTQRIEDVRSGDKVLGYDHDTGRVVETTVVHTFVNPAPARMYAVNGVRMTGNHPVYTREWGYVPAKQLDVMGGTVLKLKHGGGANGNDERVGLRMVRENVHGYNERGERRETTILFKKLRVKRILFTSGGKGSAVGANEEAARKPESASRIEGVSTLAAKPVQSGKSEKSKSQSKSRYSVAGNGIQVFKRRKRHGRDSSAETACISFGLGHGGGCKNKAATRERLSFELQNRHSLRSLENRGGGRWGFTRKRACEAARQEKGCVSFGTRMDDYQSEKRRSFERCRSRRAKGVSGSVYNIETGTGNYFAGGLLVHNCHRIKSAGGRASLFFSQLGDKIPYRLGLTGTPMPHSPLDIYAQYRFLDKSVYGTSNVIFKARYALMGGYNGKEVIGYQNEDEFRRLFESIAYQVKADVLDLPEAVHVRRGVDLCAETRRAYDKMYHTFVVQVQGGEVVASNALSKLLRLQQITSGYLPVDDTGRVAQIGADKRDGLRDVLDDLEQREPVVVFARFRHDLDQIRAAAEASGRRYMELSGRVNELKSWQDGGADVLGVQIQAGGVGIDLTRARYCVYYSVGFSLGDYEQSLARVHRPGQKNNVVYVHLVARNTVDEKVYAALDKRREVIKEILENV